VVALVGAAQILEDLIQRRRGDRDRCGGAIDAGRHRIGCGDRERTTGSRERGVEDVRASVDTREGVVGRQRRSTTRGREVDGAKVTSDLVAEGVNHSDHELERYGVCYAARSTHDEARG